MQMEMIVAGKNIELIFIWFIIWLIDLLFIVCIQSQPKAQVN